MNRQFISITTLTISHLKQVTDKLSSLKEDDLIKLDQVVNSYLLKRKNSKNIIYQEQSFQERIRSQLMALQEKNDYLLKQLDIITRNFESEKQEIKKSNQKWKNEPEQFNQTNLYQQFCKELLQELSQFRKISDYAQRLQNLKKQTGDKNFMVNSAQQFFQRVQQIMGDDQFNQLKRVDSQTNSLSEYYFNPMN